MQPQQDPKIELARVKRRYLLAALPGPLILIGAVIVSLALTGDKYAKMAGLLTLLVGCQVLVAALYVLATYLQWRTPITWTFGIGFLSFTSVWFAMQYTWTVFPSDFFLKYTAIGFAVAVALAAATGFLAANATTMFARQPQAAYLNTNLELLFPLTDDSGYATVGRKWLTPWRRRWGKPKVRIRLEHITGAELVAGPAVRVRAGGEWTIPTERAAELAEVIQQRHVARLRELQS